MLNYIRAILVTCALAGCLTITHGETVHNPPVPRSVEFAGQTIDMDRQDLYERMDRELTQMVYSHSSTLLMLKRANRFFPMMRTILEKNGAPADLVYLAAIESTLDQRAISPAKAGGLWQFIPATAKQYGLEVNDYVDERYHPEKATAAAARYLRDAYSRYGDWPAAMASYNAGGARITRELDEQDVASATDLYLNNETSRYIFRVLAAKVILSNPEKYGYKLHSDQYYPPYAYIPVTVAEPIDDLVAWAAEHGTTYALLRELNPWLRAKSLPNKSGKEYVIKVPRVDTMSHSHMHIQHQN